ncbi:MAG: HigA family addiction module antitoxin [Candidatus Nanopelagicales bacterium]|nr:HigA family addiction module antitoxin [Candidatus Nanopelagicales bacterium]
MTSDTEQRAEVFPAWEFLRDELDAREWTVTEFAEILGRPIQAVSEILNGRKSITPDTASEIAAATGTNASTWLRLQADYDLARVRRAPGSTRLSDVERRARLRSKVPLAELRKRGIVPNGSVQSQERAVCELLGIPDLEAKPSLLAAARRNNHGEAATPVQIAWLACCVRAAEHSPPPTRVRDWRVEAGTLGSSLAQILRSPQDLRELPATFARHGIQLVHVEAFKGSRIDGAALIVRGVPVVALSGRLRRLDSQVFTLAHELAHLSLGHVDKGFRLDLDLASGGSGGLEARANSRAAGWILPPITVTRPISAAKVHEAAQANNVSPAVVVGRLHQDGVLPWTHLNGLIPKVTGELRRWPTYPPAQAA